MVDNHNNPVNNENVTVEILSGNAGNNGTFSPAPPTVTQDGSGNGKYIVRFTTPIAENVTFGFKITDGTHNYSKNATTEFVINGIGVDNESTKFKVYPHDRLVGEQTTLDLYLTDDTGVNGVPNQNVAFFVVSRTFENGTVITNGNSVYITSPVIDHGNGTYTTTATTNTSQNVTFGFSANGQTNTSKVDWAKFNSNKTDLTNLNTNITATPMVTVNQNSQIVVTLVDNHNNPVNNENVTVEILSGNAGNNGTFSPAPPTVTQDGSGNGKYIVHFTTPVAENVTFGFRITDGTHNYSKNATTIFRSGSSSNNTSELVFNPVTPSVSVENNYTLTAIIRDDSMNPVGGETVTFNVSGGNLNATTCVTNADGRCYVLWTSTVTGSFTANARINGSHIKNSPAVKGFTAGVADENTSTFLLDSGPKVVGSIFNMNTTLRDKYYNVVPNQDVFYILTPAIEQAGFGSVGTEADNINITTGPQAISRNTLWSNLVGTYTVTVRIGSETGPEVNGSNKTAVFVHSTPTPANSYLNVTGLGPVDSNGGYYTVRTYAFDGVGPNPVPNAQINIAISNGTLSNGSMSGKNILCATNAAGYCEFQWTSPSEKGVFTINASFANGTALSSSPQQREFISGNANNTTSTLTILEAGPKTANGTDRYTAIVTLRDNNNLPAAGSVVIGVTGGLLDGSYISNSYSVDSVNGSVTVHWTSNQTGNFTITAALNTGYITNGVQQREFVSGPVSISDSEFIITPLSSVTADNSTAYNLRVIIRDGFRNLVPGEIVTFDVQEGYLNNGTVLPNTITCATLINGECYVSWVSDEVGNFSVNASVAAGMIGQTQYRDFVVGPPTNKYSNLTVLPTSSRVADNSSYFTATAYIKDDFNHPITGELVSFRVNGGWIDNTTDKGTTLTCVSIDGACSVRWRSDTPGTYRISANSSTITQIGVENRQFIATTGSASNSSLVVTPAGPVIAGIGVYTATVTARDTGGVAAPNAIIQFEVSGGVLNSDNCETNGTGSCFVTWTSNKSGNFSINATIGGTNLGGNGNAVEASPQYRVFEPDTPVTGNSLLVITPATNTIIANSGNFYTINVTARDTHNNTVPNKHINIHIEYGELDNGTGFAIGDSTCFTDTNGNCLVKWRSNKTGNYLVNATLAGISGIINSSAEDRSRMFAFDVVGSASYFTVTSYNASQPDNIPVCEESGSDIALCSISYNLNAFVQDNSGNKMEGANVTFKIFRGGEQVRDAYLNDIVTDGLHGTVQGEYSCLTNANGVCPANITLKANIAGTYEIYAIANGIDIEYDTTSNYNAFKTFVASKASNTTSRIHFNPIADKTVEADNVSSYDVTTEILDIHSNPINNALVTLNVPSGISWLDNSTAVNSSLTCTTASSGNCTVKWRSVRANDIQDITAQVEAITLSGNRTFVTGGVSSNTSNITVSTHYATTNDTVLVTVTVNDAQGNPIKDTYHNVIIYTSLANSSFAGGTSDHTGTLVNVNGTYSAILSSTKIGNTTLSFTIDGVSSSNTEWVHFNSSTICFENCEVSNATYITAQSPVKVGNDSLVTVYLGDTYGNPIDNLSVTIYAFENQTNSTVTLNGLENVTINGGIDGKYEANLTAYDKGTVMVSFILNSGYNINANDYGKNATVLFEPGNVSENESLVYVTHEIDNTTNASADGIDYYTVTVIARDAYGAILTESVTFSFEVDKGNLSSTNASSGDIQNITCATGSNGSCSVYWMSEDWGTGHINTYVNGKQVGIGFMNGVRVSTVPVEAEFRRVLFDDNLTIIDFTPSSKKAHIGDLIRYTVKLQNNIDQESVFNLNNLIPKGFSFVEGSIISSTANGTVNSTSISSSEFDAESLFIHKQGELIVVYTLRVGAGAKKGVHKSYAEAFKAGNSISNRAWVEVEITGDPMLDESLIFGTVYIDSNANGMQDKGEIGIPGVRIATAEGYVITTDQFGRYHLLNILGGEWGVGRNFIMKVDESSLPQGSTLTTANPLLRRLTPGLPVRFDFGVKLSNDIKTLETLMQGGAQ
ncbi:MAG: Ig-like domain-containing protein [Campylobacteraceae bacterium]|nr:Ig-like domain-containing protein [Campylobacteraceae bacterium]